MPVFLFSGLRFYFSHSLHLCLLSGGGICLGGSLPLSLSLDLLRRSAWIAKLDQTWMGVRSLRGSAWIAVLDHTWVGIGIRSSGDTLHGSFFTTFRVSVDQPILWLDVWLILFPENCIVLFAENCIVATKYRWWTSQFLSQHTPSVA